MSKKPEIDFRGITDAINQNYDRQASGAQDGFSAIPVTTVPAAPVAPEPVAEQPTRNISAPFIILEFKPSEQDATRIDSFTAYSEGVEASPEAIISHLEMVVNTIKEQVAAAKAEAGE